MTTSGSGDVVGNTTTLVNETTNMTTQNPVVEEVTGDAANSTVSTAEATNANITQNIVDEEGTQDNTTVTDLGEVTEMPTVSNVTTNVIANDTEVSIVDVTTTAAKNLTSVPDPGPSSAGPLTTESDLTLANNVSTTEASGKANSTSVQNIVTTIGTNVTNIDMIKTTTTTSTTNPATTTTTTTTTTEEVKIPTTSNPHVSAANTSAIKLEERADLGSYGYTSEVVLICFCVIFGLLFFGMVGKYYQLKKNIGDYRLQQVRKRNVGEKENIHDVCSRALSRRTTILPLVASECKTATVPPDDWHRSST